MSEITRYDPDYTDSPLLLKEDKAGRYVRFSEHQQALAEKDVQIACLKAELNRLRERVRKEKP